jgi:hypothetical protein
MNDPSPWLRLAGPALQTIRGLVGLVPKKSRDRLIFIEQPLSSWVDEPTLTGIQLHLLVHVTNDSSTDGVILSRIQVQRTGWKFAFRKDPWQDCMMVDIGDDRLMPMTVGPILQPGATAVMRILHHHKANQPEPKQSVKFRLKVTDQRRRLHYTYLTVPPR